jgi:hypothetical protein
MHPIGLAVVVFVGVFGGALLGMRLRAAVPQPHLSAETKDVVKLAMGLVATMTALILGLLLASAKASYDTQKSDVIQISAKVAFLDRVLAMYGPDAADARRVLRGTFEEVLADMWPEGHSRPARLEPAASSGRALYHAVQKLAPRDDEQRGLKSQTVQLVAELGQMRWLLFEQAGTSISAPLLGVVSAWLAVIFASFGLFAPPNHTVIVALMVASLCVAGSIFLILELDQPFRGVVRIPSDSLRSAVQHLGN